MQVFEDGGFVEDSAGGTEFDEVVGEERSYEGGVSTDGWVEEMFIEAPEVIFEVVFEVSFEVIVDWHVRLFR